MLISFNAKTALGVYLILVGFLMIIFHKQVKQMRDDWYENLPAVFMRGPTGTLLTMTIILFGAISILVGTVLLSLASIQ